MPFFRDINIQWPENSTGVWCVNFNAPLLINAPYITIHSKNTRVSMTRKRVCWGQTPFRVNDDPEISQLDAKYDPELGQSDPIICQFD